MKKLLAGLLLISSVCAAETIATLPNKAGGKIVLTDEACVHQGKTYTGLNRAYNYGSSGYTFEGCYTVEDETVVIVWQDGDKMRYPVQNFTLKPKKQSKNFY